MITQTEYMEQKIIGAILIFVTLFAPMPDKKASHSQDQSLTHESAEELNDIPVRVPDNSTKKFNP